MSWLVLAFIVTAAVLAPFFGADTRDGHNWQPGPADRDHDLLSPADR